MKDKIHGLLVSAISELYESKDLSIEIVKTKSEEHGDWSSNIAMVEAKKKGENPKELAKKIINSISKEDWIENYFIQGTAYAEMYEEHFHKPINQIVILIVTEEGTTQVFKKDKKEFLPKLEESVKQFYDWIENEKQEMYKDDNYVRGKISIFFFFFVSGTHKMQA